MFVSDVACFRVHHGKSVADEVSEISSTEALSYSDVRPSFDAVIASKPQLSSSPFTDKTTSPFALAAKTNATGISPKKSPLSSVAAVGISRTSSGISGARNFPADRHVSATSSFMKSDHISRLNFNSVSTTSTSNDLDSSVHWLSSFSEARTPGNGFTSPPQPAGSLASPVNSIDDDMSPPVLRPKVRRMSHRTPDKSPLVTSSSGDTLELGKPSVGLGQPPGISDSDAIDFEAELSDSLAVFDTGINSTTQFSTSSTIDNDVDDQALYDRLSVNAKNTKHSRSDSYSSVGSDRRNGHKVSKSSAKEKATSKSGSRSAKQKAKSPAAAAEDYERQRAELDNAFEAACRLPSTVRGQPSSAADKSSGRANYRASLDSQKVSCLLLTYVISRTVKKYKMSLLIVNSFSQ